MTTTAVFLVCLGGIAACAALIFVVETLVAFGLHRNVNQKGQANAVFHLPVMTTDPVVGIEDDLLKEAA